MFLRRVKLRGQQMELLAGYQALLVGATKNPRDFTVPNVVREFQNHFCHGVPPIPWAASLHNRRDSSS
jgi:hypothetical protein